ncbi:ABC transporter substrate-binding protein [Candidatus Sumerlaeota bacterium]|nr:ABC transporter substrate-binding protein [Candidatus Sumerlaeota bacterium]
MLRAIFCVACFLAIGALGFSDADTSPTQFTVLVVMSYEEAYPWNGEIREGLEAALATDECRIEYFYMNVKVDPAGGPKRAKKAHDLYRELKPDGAIVSDDAGQSMFVVPYLAGKVDTPVMFCGVNAEPQEYGYPTSNVSGVLEREPMKQSLLFLRELVPSAKKFAFISQGTPTLKAVEKQLLDEKDSYPLEYVGSRTVQSLPEAVAQVRELRSECDCLLYITMEGLADESGKPLTDQEIIPTLVQAFEGPVITNALYRVKCGALGAVVKAGQEHGRLAAENLLKAMKGTPVSEIPIIQNRFGRRILNVDAMKALGIRPDPSLIRSAELVRTEP